MKFTKSKKVLVLFLFGFFFYMGVEVLWGAMHGSLVGFQEKSHLSLCGNSSVWMGFLGGFIFLILGKLNEFEVIREKLPLSVQCLIGAVIITVLEFLCGVVLNVWMKLDIWNYEGYPFAHLFLNQINLFHFVMWFFISIPVFWLDDVLRWVLFKLGADSQCNNIYNLVWLAKHLFSKKAPQLERLENIPDEPVIEEEQGVELIAETPAEPTIPEPILAVEN